MLTVLFNYTAIVVCKILQNKCPLNKGNNLLETVCICSQMLPLSTNIKEAYKHGRDDEQNFIQNLSLFLCTFLKEHGQLIEKRTELSETLLEVCGHMLTVFRMHFEVNRN